MQGGEFGAGVDPQFLDEPAPEVVVRRERLALAARRVERPHLDRAQPLPQRVPGDEIGQFPGEQHMVPRLPAGLRLLLQHGQPLFREALGGLPGERGVREVRVRGAPPQPECLGEQRGPRAGIPYRAGLGHQGPEAVGVHLVRAALQPQPVARGLPHHAVAAEHPAQLGDLGLERARGPSGRRVAPEVMDQPVDGDRAAVVGEEVRQQGPDLALGDGDVVPLAVPHHQWPEHPKPHTRHRTCGERGRSSAFPKLSRSPPEHSRDRCR